MPELSEKYDVPMPRARDRVVDVVLRYTQMSFPRYCLEKDGETLVQMTPDQFKKFIEDVEAMKLHEFGRDMEYA